MSGSAPLYAQSFGYSLAMRVLQSDLYGQLDPVERGECDELIRRGMSGGLTLAHPFAVNAFAAGAAVIPIAPISTWRGSAGKPLVRICWDNGPECERNCNIGPCATARVDLGFAEDAWELLDAAFDSADAARADELRAIVRKALDADGVQDEGGSDGEV